MTKYVLREIQTDDFDDLVKIYNSNKEFLMHHLNRETIDIEWLIKESKDMKVSNFQSIGVVDKEKNKLIGHFDFKMGEEAYLSLFMLGLSYQGSGLGSKLFKLFEETILNKCQSIRIDVVKGYDANVQNFWLKEGFEIDKEIDLEWDGNKLTADRMMKNY